MATRPDLLQGDIRSTLISMTLPMMFGIVSLMLFNIADLYFVSRLGTAPLAAMGFTFPVCFTVISLAIGLGIGTSAILARLLGAGDKGEARSLASDNLIAVTVLILVLSLLFKLLLPFVFTAMGAEAELLPLIFSYMEIWLIGSVFLVVNMVCNACMRATGDTKTPAMLMAGSSLLNFFLDPLLIFGVGPFSGLGIMGAAIASCIAWSLTTVVALYILFHKKKLLVFQPMDIGRCASHSYRVMKIGIPAALSNMMTPLAQGVLTYLVSAHGAEAVAAFGVGNRIESLSLLVCLSLSMTLPPIISQNYGAGQIQRVKLAYRLSSKFAVIWQIAVFILLLLVAEPVANAFSSNTEVQKIIILWVCIVPIGFGFQAVTFLTASGFNALHQPMRAMRISIVRLFIFTLPFAWCGSQLFGIEGMFSALVIANALMAIFSFKAMNRYIQKL
ncbi:MAG: MATE family efflux transporter [Neptuniibacter sp.]